MPGLNAQAAQLTEARKAVPWLAEGSQTVQQQALRDLDQAFGSWWRNPGHFGRPTWRRKGIHEGFRVVGPQARRWERLSRKRARVLIPKVGWVDFRWSRHPGDPKSYRIKRDPAGRWWISFAAIPDPVCGPGDQSAVGVDMGVANSATTSDGDVFHWPGLTDAEKARLLRLQRKLARQTRGSNRRETTKRQIARIKHRGINRRNDAIEKTTTQLARSNDLIVVEDLQITNMVRSAAGTIDQPGTGVAQKTGLNRSIHTQAWGRFLQRLEDKAPGRVARVNPAFTSRRCRLCGHTENNNRKSQAVFSCVACGHSANADVNAAQNILDAGWALTARGGPPLGEPAKREPLAA